LTSFNRLGIELGDQMSGARILRPYRRYIWGGSLALTAVTALAIGRRHDARHTSTTKSTDWKALPPRIKSRAEIMEDLRSSVSNPDSVFDILVIGGGATGTGIALDAVTRGLKVALVEREDFASGTSSQSTKLVHGGVRYLEKAVLQLDIEQ